ncbi:MAG: TIGR03557 family F420-dependent LLM class oxidoreductase [Gammaproteobacteria bacterium]|nr:TIGR03557 family F420-dependent LLM class oxidoreductase [Gammaproteobacteria bacterium]
MTRFAYFCGHEQWQPEELVEHARLAEDAGFDLVVVSEHFHPWVDDTSAAGFAFSTIGAMTTATDHIGFATGVTTPLWRFHPAVVAQAAATLDRLSGGRFHLGVGTGENINEGPLGYSFPKYAERAARMNEALQIMRRLLDGETLSFDGEYYSTNRAKLYSPPTGKVPIWLAAGGPKSAALAARRAEGVITSVKDPASTLEHVVQPARAVAETEGRPAPTLVVTRWAVFAGSDDEAWQALSAWRGLRAPGRLEAVDPAVLRARADDLPRDEILSRYTIAASPQDIIDAYLPLITDLGADVVTIQMTSTDQPALISLLGNEVLPVLQRSGRPTS